MGLLFLLVFPALLGVLFYALRRFQAWQVLLACSILAVCASELLEYLANQDSDWHFYGFGAFSWLLRLESSGDHNSNWYVIPILIGIWFFFLASHFVEKPFRFDEVMRPLPAWALYFVLMGSIFIIYPFSSTLQNIGYAPLFILAAVVDLLLCAMRKRGVGLTALTATVGLAVFIWLWASAGSNDRVVLPVDLPEVQNAQFTSEGATKALVTAVDNFPPEASPLRESRAVAPDPEKTPNVSLFTSLSQELGSKGFLGVDAPHAIGQAELGGVHLETVYHSLRHLRHKPTLEAQVLIGDDGSLTLGLRRSDFAPACYGQQLPQKLLNHQFVHRRKGALRELQEIIYRDVEYEEKTGRRTASECNPSWQVKLLRRLGLSNIPGAQDERISNVTVEGTRPDEQLNQLISRALFEGMDRISPERLGLFYDRNGRPESALRYYRAALPSVVQQASDHYGDARSRFRVAELLMRIADLGVNPKRDEDSSRKNAPEVDFKETARLYEGAIALAPEDARAYAFQGYFLLFHSRALYLDEIRGMTEALDSRLEWIKSWYPDRFREQPEKDARSNYQREKDALDNRFRDYYRRAEESFRNAIQLLSKTELQSEYGKEFTRNLLIFSQKNLAVALAFQVEPRTVGDPDRDDHLKSAVRALEEAKKAMRERDPEKYQDSNNDPESDDPEMLATLGYVLSLEGKCTESLAKFDSATDITLASGSEPREQLLLINGGYVQAMQKCGDKGLLSVFQALLDLYLAQDHYGRGMLDVSAKDLSDAEVAARKAPPSFSSRRRYQAIFAYAHGFVLWKWACDPKKRIEEFKKNELQDKRFEKNKVQNKEEEQTEEQKVRNEMLREAVQLERRAIELNSEDWDVRAFWARLLAMSPETDSRAIGSALTDATQAAEIQPDNVNFKLALGTVQLREGKLNAALKSYREAAKLNSDSLNPEAHYLLGFALMQAGASEEARDEWKFAKSLDPERWLYISNPLRGCGPILGRKEGPSKNR